MKILQDLMDEIFEWSDKTFENQNSISKINHLKKEIDELKASIFHEHGELEKKMEFADCFMLLILIAKMEGLSANDLIESTNLKLGINKNRAWGKPDKDGIVEHIREIN